MLSSFSTCSLLQFKKNDNFKSPWKHVCMQIETLYFHIMMIREFLKWWRCLFFTERYTRAGNNEVSMTCGYI